MRDGTFPARIFLTVLKSNTAIASTVPGNKLHQNRRNDGADKDVGDGGDEEEEDEVLGEDSIPP